MPELPDPPAYDPSYDVPSFHMPTVLVDVENYDLEGPAAGYWVLEVEPKDEIGMLEKSEIDQLELEQFHIIEVKKDGETLVPVEEFEKIIESMPLHARTRMDQALHEALISKIEEPKEYDPFDDPHYEPKTLFSTSLKEAEIAEGDVLEVANQFKERLEVDSDSDLEMFIQDWAAALGLGAEGVEDLYEEVYNKLKGWNILSSKEEVKRLKKIAKGLKA